MLASRALVNQASGGIKRRRRGLLRHLYARCPIRWRHRTDGTVASKNAGAANQSLSGGMPQPTARAKAMIDRFLTRIVNAHSFLAKLWVLARPYWFTQDRSTIRLGGIVFTVKEAWIGRFVL